MQRIEAYDKAQYEPNSLFKALRERLSTTTKKTQNYLVLICCQKHKPHPAPTYIVGRVWCHDKDKQVYH
jgi:hypothetical protein